MKRDCFAYIDSPGGSCGVLTTNKCDNCRFYKPMAQYRQEFDDAIQKNRDLDNCVMCKYQKRKCKKFSEGAKGFARVISE